MNIEIAHYQKSNNDNIEGKLITFTTDDKIYVLSMNLLLNEMKDCKILNNKVVDIECARKIWNIHVNGFGFTRIL
jgi:hypothetical protein